MFDKFNNNENKICVIGLLKGNSQEVNHVQIFIAELHIRRWQRRYPICCYQISARVQLEMLSYLALKPS